MLILGGDLETTGFKADKGHRIVEVNLQLWDSKSRKLVRNIDFLVNPLREIPIEASRVHGIYLEDLQTAPTWDKIAPIVGKAIQVADLFVAHNASFDRTFLHHELNRVGVPMKNIDTFCTMQNSRAWATGTGKSPKLAELCWTLGVDYDPALAHRASYDVTAMMNALWAGIDAEGFFLPDMEVTA